MHMVELSVMNCCAPVAKLQGVSVRKAEARDLAIVQTLLRDASLPTEGVADHFDAGYAIAERGGRVLGAAGLEFYDGDALLRSVVVAKPFRGLGVGELLVHERLRFAREAGARDVYLLTTTAAPFFARLG